MSRKPIVIVGGGISGLAAAYELTRRGIPVRVLEASARAGGLIHTDYVDGFTIEAGPDSILNAKPAALALVRELGLAAELQAVREGARAFVLKGRTLHALPQPSFLGIPLTAAALANYDLLSPEGRARMALEPTIPPRAIDDDETVGAFFKRRFGPEAVDLIAQPLLGGIHAGDIDALSMRSLFPRLLEAERRHGTVMPGGGAGGARREAGGARREAGSVGFDTDGTAGEDRAGAIKGFASLRGGMATLVKAIVAALPSGTIEYHARVESLADVDAACTIVAVQGYAAATMIVSIDPKAAALCATVPYVSTASVALAWPRHQVPHPLDGTGFVVARRYCDARITACTWVSSKWEARAPDGQALLRAFVGGVHDPDAAALSDDELVATARRDLEATLGITEEPSLTRVYRWPRAGAQHVVGHLDRVGEIERRLAPRGIFVTGSGFRATGIPDCIADGRRVAAVAADYLIRGRR
jgi:oxygen-dependent protoporphyrinogen oxidase